MLTIYGFLLSLLLFAPINGMRDPDCNDDDDDGVQVASLLRNNDDDSSTSSGSRTSSEMVFMNRDTAREQCALEMYEAQKDNLEGGEVELRRVLISLPRMIIPGTDTIAQVVKGIYSGVPPVNGIPERITKLAQWIRKNDSTWTVRDFDRERFPGSLIKFLKDGRYRRRANGAGLLTLTLSNEKTDELKAQYNESFDIEDGTLYDIEEHKNEVMQYLNMKNQFQACCVGTAFGIVSTIIFGAIIIAQHHCSS